MYVLSFKLYLKEFDLKNLKLFKKNCKFKSTILKF